MCLQIIYSQEQLHQKEVYSKSSGGPAKNVTRCSFLHPGATEEKLHLTDFSLLFRDYSACSLRQILELAPFAQDAEGKARQSTGLAREEQFNVVSWVEYRA